MQRHRQHFNINHQSCIFRVVQVIKALQDPLEVRNSLLGINDNVRERGLQQKCFYLLTYSIEYFIEQHVKNGHANHDLKAVA